MRDLFSQCEYVCTYVLCRSHLGKSISFGTLMNIDLSHEVKIREDSNERLEECTKQLERLGTPGVEEVEC